MKRISEVWNSIGTRMQPRLELPESAGLALGFRPALLNVATMHIHPCGSPETLAPLRNGMIAGFVRGGFFYTRRAAARACKEWGFGC